MKASDWKLRFWAKVRKTDGCWLWTASTLGDYGCLAINRKNRGAHRISYELHYGPIPKGMFVCHRCDTPRCVRPEHLFLGTPKDNSLDMTRKGRAPRGDKHFTHAHPEKLQMGVQRYNHKITEQDVRDIRRLKSEGLSTLVLSKRFGISRKDIDLIAARIGWRHVI